jgi:precorrin-6B methylase 1
MEFPVRALIAGIEVTTAVRSTKTKLAFARMKWGINEIEIIPAAGSSNAEKNNKDSVIDMVYPLYTQLFFFASGDLQWIP